MRNTTPPKSVTSIFNAYDTQANDRTSRILRPIFKLSMLIVLCYPVGAILEQYFKSESVQRIGGIIATTSAFTFFFTIILSVLMGAHSYGLNNGSRNFGHSVLLVLGKTFLYIFLPAIILSAIIILIAALSDQPTVFNS